MEIADYLRIARRRLWVLVLVPLLAATAALLYVLQSPPQYSASATLSSTAFVGGPSNQYTGTQAASQFAAAFTASANGPAVLAKAAEETHIPVGELAGGLSVAQNGASSNMTLTYTSEHSGDIERTLTAIEEATLNKMFGGQVTLAKSVVDDAAAKAAAETQKLKRNVTLFGPSDPQTAYQRQLTRLAVQGLISAQAAYQTAKNQQDATQADDVLFISDVHSVSRRSELIRTVIPVVGAAIFLGVLLVMVLELLASARRPQERNESLSPGGSLLRTGSTSEPVVRRE